MELVSYKAAGSTEIYQIKNHFFDYITSLMSQRESQLIPTCPGENWDDESNDNRLTSFFVEGWQGLRSLTNVNMALALATQSMNGSDGSIKSEEPDNFEIDFRIKSAVFGTKFVVLTKPEVIEFHELASNVNPPTDSILTVDLITKPNEERLIATRLLNRILLELMLLEWMLKSMLLK